VEKIVSKAGEAFSESGLLRMCKVSRSSFEQRKKARLSAQEKQEEKQKEEDGLKELIRKIIKKLGYVPGERSFKTFLWRDYSITIGRKLIRRLMKEMHISANTPKKDAYKGMARHDHPCTAPENLVNQNFRIAPRKIICTDITYLYFGILRMTIYLCVFRDAYTKEILGWAVRRMMTTELVKAAYDMMIEKHGKELKNPGVIIHSDQGSQYLSTTFKQILSDDGFLQSVSARGNSQDNAAVESFFSRMKTACLDLIALCRNFEQVEELLTGYFNAYNNEIYQYDLAGLTPHEFYQYCVTGIYPCDNYFGVKALKLRSLESIIQNRLEAAEEKARKMREIYRERSRAAQLLRKDPLQLTIDDQLLLIRVIKRYTKHRDKMNEEIERLKSVLEEARKAQEFMASLTQEERDHFRAPQAWQTEPKLSYIYGMGGLF